MPFCGISTSASARHGVRLLPADWARITSPAWFCRATSIWIPWAIELKLNIQFKGRGMKLYGYCGIYYVEEGVSVTSMIDRAKLAEESILSDHVQPFAVFDDSMRRLYVDQMELMSEYETAIANEEFKVYYQPVVEATSGNLISAEALVRWVHPQRGLVSPAAFIPALENGGHISKLDWFIADRWPRWTSGATQRAFRLSPFPSTCLGWTSMMRKCCSGLWSC